MAYRTQEDGTPVDLSSFSEDERLKLIEVMKKAKEFQAKEEQQLLIPLEGQLLKFTNVMKGWQFRWFSLEPESGMFEYFEKEENKTQRPRGSVHLAGAVVCPSDEDSQTFNVNAASGEVYRLKAHDAKDRQHWINRLRSVAEYHTNNLVQNLPQSSTYSSTSDLRRTSANTSGSGLSHTASNHQQHRSSGQIITQETNVQTTSPKVTIRSHHKTVSSTSSTVIDPLKSVKDIISHVGDHKEHLLEKFEELPSSGNYINGLDKDILLLKATSRATIACIEECVSMLQQQTLGLQGGGNVEWFDRLSVELPVTPILNPKSLTNTSKQALTDTISTTDIPYPSCDEHGIYHDEDVEDSVEYHDTDLGGMEEHKSIILHLLGQLKLGMDLTRVVLPTFILERRSLLEMFADCMAHPQVLLKVPDLADPESRMIQVLEWYLTSFHAGRQGSVAKKPYNPIIGETFHCSWKVPKSEKPSPAGKISPPSSNSTFYVNEDVESDVVQPTETTIQNGDDGAYTMTYLAEQVSHHPPVSAFYFECPERQVSINASIWTKSKFYGMSIGVVMVGKVSLKVLKHDEEYVFGLPSAYARSILTYPWVELGDKINVTCQKSGYSSAITFHTKPFYGGKLHRVTAEVKNPDNAIVCKVNGEWNSFFEFQYANDETKTIYVNDLEIMHKRVRPLPKQGDFESRKLWSHVTNALSVGDVTTATEHKKFLEDRQRQGERSRKEANSAYPTKFFHKVDETWTYTKLLQKSD